MSPPEQVVFVFATLWKIATANGVAFLIFGAGLALWGILPARFKRIS